MEINQLRVRPVYYFSWPDQEILDDHFLSLPCDEETWLYKVDVRTKGQYRYFELGSPFQNLHTSTVGGMVDTRTFTRRKHCALRLSLESSLSNRSSLGLLSSSNLLNNTLQSMESPQSENQERTSSNSIGSEKKCSTPRGFKLDTPFTNVAALGGSKCLATNFIFDRTRLNSDSCDISVPYSLENCSFVEKNGQMTDSLINFLENQDHKTDIQTAQADKSDSEFLVNSIDPVNCRPPSGFRDNEMTESVVNIHDVDDFPNCQMTNSIKDYLENVKSNTPTHLLKNIASSETENIPPINNDEYQNLIDTITVIDDGRGVENKKHNSTYDLDKHGTFDLGKNGDTTYDLNNLMDEIGNIPFTNTVNILRKNNERSSCNDDFNKTKSLNVSYEKKINSVQEKSEQSYKIKALNNRDLNEMIKSSRHIPSKNSPFNTTFTKLSPKGSVVNSDVSKLKCNMSVEMLNSGLEDDTSSSASDSSFSCRSVDELRTIAQQQECSLVQQTSTPVESSIKSPSKLVNLDINISPIRRQTVGGYHSESRSANSSPIRDHQQPQTYHHPISRLRHATTGASQHMMPASSMSNIARPKLSGLRMPKPVRRFTAPQKVESRPSTAPIQGIPRPQISRLPMPRLRGSGIPGSKQQHL